MNMIDSITKDWSDSSNLFEILAVILTKIPQSESFLSKISKDALQVENNNNSLN